MAEPRFGFKNVYKAKRAGKIKGYFTLRIPTESIGTIELPGCKVIDGGRGCFASLPSRVIERPMNQAIDVNGQAVTGEANKPKYLNVIRFESVEHFKDFKKELDEVLLPQIMTQL